MFGINLGDTFKQLQKGVTDIITDAAQTGTIDLGKLSIGGFSIPGNLKFPIGGPTQRQYVKGWTPRMTQNSDHKSTIRDIGKGLARTSPFLSHETDKSGSFFDEIKAKCMASGTKWEDPEFPAIAGSLFFKKPPSAWPNIQWKRPHEICNNPQLYVGGGSRMDVIQGILGDCWLLAAVASLTINEKLLHKVVSPEQSFQKDYCGIFRFRFWQYGRWVEVYIDDRLPTKNGRLIYMHSEDKNEFWSALLEKAYAKICGSYEALSGGLTSEALTDFTGGVVERYELRSQAPSDLFEIMLKAYKKGSLMGCSIDAEAHQMEAQLSNGLIIGHAYSITDVRYITVKTMKTQGQLPMLRIRNPWGDSHEWKGAWSDGSQEWQLVPQEEKKQLGLTFDHDGEFWMTYRDFVINYQKLEICFLGPDSLTDKEEIQGKRKWEGTLFEGGWKRRVNAGGCRNYISTFWTNPQYQVRITEPDVGDKSNKGTIIVGVMQKDRRKLKKLGEDMLTIGYAVYRANPNQQGTLDKKFFERNTSVAKSQAFSNLRELSDHHKLPIGDYIIVPSTFEPNEEGDFILRIFSERINDQAQELDDETGVDDAKIAIPKAPDSVQDAGMQAFLNMAGADRLIDAFELQNILNSAFMKDFKFKGFSVDITRSMVAMKDVNFLGKLNFEDFKALWVDLTMCKRAFKAADTESSGCFDSYEFKTVLSTLGFHVSNATYNAIVMRYSDKEGKVRFDDFVNCYMKLKTLFDSFRKKKKVPTATLR